MSQFLGAADPNSGYLALKDVRLDPAPFNIQAGMDKVVPRIEGWATPYWPGVRSFAGDQATDVAIASAIWSRPVARIAQGIASRLGFVGTTRDQYGTPLGGVTCSLFRTSDKLWIMDIVSDANGNFLLQTFFSPDTHFIVFSKSGAPDVFGTTKQTLVGA